MLDESRTGQIVMLIREGSTQHAVRAYQEETGVSLGDARQQVRALARRHGIPMRRHGGISFLIVVLASLFGTLLSH